MVNKGDKMKIVMQRVKEASVSIDEKIAGAINQGLLLLVGVGPDDAAEDLAYAVRKIVNMRIFSDADGKMNQSIQDIKGSILSVSQFTLYADTKREIAQPLQELQSLIWLASFMIALMNNWQILCQLSVAFLGQICRLVSSMMDQLRLF